EADGDRYVRETVFIDSRPVDYHLDADLILPGHSLRLDKATVFLKCLVLGTKYDLLELIDENKEHYYLRDNEGMIVPLEYKVVLNCRQNVEVHYGFRETLMAVNRSEKN